MQADLVFLNGRIETMNRAQPQAEALAVCGDKITLVGDAETIKAEIGRTTRVVDLQGRALLPGFVDAHCHTAMYGESRTFLSLRPDDVASLDELLEKVRQAAAERPASSWIRGRGWDDTRLPPNYALTRNDLDRAAPDHPVFLSRVCGHAIVANSRALALAGVTRETPDPPGGSIARDERGEPTGILTETAIYQVYEAIPPATMSDTMSHIKAASQDYLAAGITSVHDAGIDAEGLAAYQALHERGELPLRVYMMVQEKLLDSLIAAGMHTGFGDEWLRVGCLKLLQDGSMGARTAAMLQPYKDQADNYGILWMEQAALDEVVDRAHAAGFQVAVHAIGDRAITSVLDAFEAALRRRPRTDHRHRIEHCEVAIDGLIDRIQSLGVLPSVQPIFMAEFALAYIGNLGGERAHRIYPFPEYLGRGMALAGGSDSPVSSFAPMHGVAASVTRKAWDGRELGPGQGIPVAEALRMHTWGGAFFSFEEGLKGKLAPGMLADLVVLGRDPFTAPADELAAIPVHMTVVGGRVAYER